MCTVGFTCVVRQVTCVGLGVRSDVWSRPMLDPSMVTLGKGVLLKKKKQNDGIHSRNLYNKCDWVLKVFADFF